MCIDNIRKNLAREVKISVDVEAVQGSCNGILVTHFRSTLPTFASDEFTVESFFRITVVLHPLHMTSQLNLLRHVMVAISGIQLERKPRRS